MEQKYSAEATRESHGRHQRAARLHGGAIHTEPWVRQRLVDRQYSCRRIHDEQALDKVLCLRVSHAILPSAH
jgi:hypothetical protein